MTPRKDQQENPFLTLIPRWRGDTPQMVRDIWAVEPYPDQIELMAAYDRRKRIDLGHEEEAKPGENRRIAKRSGHGVGKSTANAWMIINHILCYYPQKTVCTAPTMAQLFDALAAETKAWIQKMPPALRDLFEVKHDRIELKARPEDSFVSFRTSSPEKPEALAGVHSAGHVLLIADEASGIPDAVFETAAGSMSGHNAITILTGNPVRTSGLFFEVFRSLKDEWTTLHTSCVGHPNVAPDFVRQMALQYGENSNAYRVRVLGEFPLADDDAVIPFELLEAALKRDVKPMLVRPVWGLDCARKGADRSALAKRRGNVLLEPVKTWEGLETMELVGRVKAEYDATMPSARPAEILVDAIGIGAGVADRLRELGLPIRSINVSESPSLGDRYLNLKAELWWRGREWFQARDCNIAGDEKLMTELSIVEYGYTSAGKIKIVPKEETKKKHPKIGSPDRADAFILTFAAHAAIASAGNKGNLSWNQPLKRGIKGLV